MLGGRSDRPDDLVDYLTVQYHRHRNDPDSIYCVRAYGQHEFLTIFAPDASFVDRSFAYVDNIIEIMQGRKKLLLQRTWERELYFKGNDLAEYLRFSAGLYKKYGKPPFYRSPLIIFPDRSSFRIEF